MISASLPAPEQLKDFSVSEPPVLLPITDLQRAFATHYLLDYNERSAAVAVGLNPGQGAVLLRDPGVMQHVSALQTAREKFCILGKDFAAAQWLQILPMLKGEVAVPFVTKNGSELSAKKFFASELVRALVEINNISGLSKPIDSGSKKAAVHISLNFAGMAAQEIPTVVIDSET